MGWGGGGGWGWGVVVSDRTINNPSPNLALRTLLAEVNLLAEVKSGPNGTEMHILALLEEKTVNRGHRHLSVVCRPPVSLLSLSIMHGFLSNCCCFPWALRWEVF